MADAAPWQLSLAGGSSPRSGEDCRGVLKGVRFFFFLGTPPKSGGLSFWFPCKTKQKKGPAQRKEVLKGIFFACSETACNDFWVPFWSI